ncbi:hypothetical protein BDV35DRAFT_341260 [Aspergillus flavus]|uniref:Uncharacterized protein n=1 Tax=Aspergillus flavus TaxID=5059 RepID=A0A5N6H8F2_ASPFL|nr:hypothetical protein BDV35DRAFT_341260 [Aspergillus flavus]
MLLSRISVLLIPIYGPLATFTCALIVWCPDSLHHRVSLSAKRNSILRIDTQPT